VTGFGKMGGWVGRLVVAAKISRRRNLGSGGGGEGQELSEKTKRNSACGSKSHHSDGWFSNNHLEFEPWMLRDRVLEGIRQYTIGGVGSRQKGLDCNYGTEVKVKVGECKVRGRGAGKKVQQKEK